MKMEQIRRMWAPTSGKISSDWLMGRDSTNPVMPAPTKRCAPENQTCAKMKHNENRRWKIPFFLGKFPSKAHVFFFVGVGGSKTWHRLWVEKSGLPNVLPNWDYCCSDALRAATVKSWSNWNSYFSHQRINPVGNMAEHDFVGDVWSKHPTGSLTGLDPSWNEQMGNPFNAGSDAGSFKLSRHISAYLRQITSHLILTNLYQFLISGAVKLLIRIIMASQHAPM